MFGRGIFRVLAVVALVAVMAGIGIGVYNAGVSEGVAEAVRAAAASGDTPAVVYPPYVGGPQGYGYGYGGWGGGPGFFGIVLWILGFFLIVGLLRAAFGRGRWSGGGPHRGGWDRGERIADMHRELHRRDEPPAPAG